MNKVICGGHRRVSALDGISAPVAFFRSSLSFTYKSPLVLAHWLRLRLTYSSPLPADQPIKTLKISIHLYNAVAIDAGSKSRVYSSTEASGRPVYL